MDIKFQAYEFAKKVHKGQVRKDGVDYIVHPEEVATILAKNGADDTLICAGLLHDTIEDAKVTKEELYSQFPKEIVDIVVMDSENKALTWEERKEDVIEKLRTCNNRSFCMLMCADKLSNLRSIKKEYDIKGEDVWKVFKRGKESQKWFYENLVDALSSLSDMDMYQELSKIVKELFQEEKYGY
jgi:(p)ppGpp synthase/HD superfamily hydrolase